jgi:hypothetical protein
MPVLRSRISIKIPSKIGTNIHFSMCLGTLFLSIKPQEGGDETDVAAVGAVGFYRESS